MIQSNGKIGELKKTTAAIQQRQTVADVIQKKSSNYLAATITGCQTITHTQQLCMTILNWEVLCSIKRYHLVKKLMFRMVEGGRHLGPTWK